MALSEAHELVASFGDLLVESREPRVIWPAMFTRLQEVIGFDAGYIAASWGNTTEGRGAVVGHDEPFLKRNLGRYLREISAEEAAAYTDSARNHDDIWSSLRRKELAVFNEVLDPTRMRHMLVRVSVRSGNIAGFNLERRGICSRFSERELALVDMIGPLLHIVELLTLETSTDDEAANYMVAEYGLSKREAEFAGLVTKGLQNGEIALLSGVSINTVRNTLARVFEKVGVSNRAELSYVTAQPRSERGASLLARATAPTNADDGTRAFMQRVIEASAMKAPPPDSEPRFRSPPHIIYTPPLQQSSLGAGVVVAK